MFINQRSFMISHITMQHSCFRSKANIMQEFTSDRDSLKQNFALRKTTLV